MWKAVGCSGPDVSAARGSHGSVARQVRALPARQQVLLGSPPWRLRRRRRPQGNNAEVGGGASVRVTGRPELPIATELRGLATRQRQRLFVTVPLGLCRGTRRSSSSRMGRQSTRRRRRAPKNGTGDDDDDDAMLLLIPVNNKTCSCCALLAIYGKLMIRVKYECTISK
uniref:Uncharacterized protein n=1 Tax=Oryza meridionalis TaxID=40149 RepID=A0A0E0FCJ9_9ORYZ